MGGPPHRLAKEGSPIPSPEVDGSTTPKDSTRIEIQDHHLIRELTGEHHRNLRSMEQALGVGISVRGNRITLQGSAEKRAQAEGLIEQLSALLQRGLPLSPEDIHHATTVVASGYDGPLDDFLLDTVLVNTRKKPVTPRSPNQKRYIEAIRNHDVVFGLGPAGTGKTYLAVAMAVSALQAGDVRRIILTRPAVEAGEKLGFLPGDLAEKVNPYLRPLYDALHDMMPTAKCSKMMENRTIEVAPLAFMRGRTLNRAFVILDEAQNTTPEQMKMFLTRLGNGSKMVVTGDVTQVDLPAGRSSGLQVVRRILSGNADIPFVYFDRIDVVRHPLVQQIIKAYERLDEERLGRQPKNKTEQPDRG